MNDSTDPPSPSLPPLISLIAFVLFSFGGENRELEPHSSSWLIWRAVRW